MRIKRFDTREALIRSGRDAFLRQGFEKASLRDICAAAHVTTGAFYSNFDKKEDLFRAVIESDLADYTDLYDGLIDRLVGRDLEDDDGEGKVMDFIMGHKDLFKLLFDCSKGTSYEGFKDELLAKFDKTYQEFFDAYAKSPVDSDVIHTLVRMKFAQYCEMIYGDFDAERVRFITGELSKFTTAGLEALLDTSF